MRRIESEMAQLGFTKKILGITINDTKSSFSENQTLSNGIVHLLYEEKPNNELRE